MKAEGLQPAPHLLLRQPAHGEGASEVSRLEHSEPCIGERANRHLLNVEAMTSYIRALDHNLPGYGKPSLNGLRAPGK